ncbi:MAG: prepilin-type N-terminal cleavage/methylation domain-containing protein [Sedimentisphaerales bacterium]|nr:prepilin-type N-terminal cleavage/methylation domain-containing protein [Sedimentisphaerales bacterium]
MKRKGFTLIELMVVILIVAILAAVAIPIMRGRLEAAKWSEGKAMMGTIATALRAYQAERGEGTATNQGPQPAVTGNTAPTLGFTTADLTGTYFSAAEFSISAYANPVGGPFTFTISCTPGSGSSLTDKATRTLTSAGVWAP